MLIENIVIGNYQTNAYLVAEAEGMDAFIIDPAGDYERIVQSIEKNKLNLKYIILTHGHGDHIGAVESLREKYNCEVLIHEDDVYMLKDKIHNLTAYTGEEMEIEPDKTFVDNEELVVGTLKLKFLHTPGHTRGSSCVLVKSILFSGDTLFLNSIGRTDLEGGDRDIILSSIREKLLILPVDVVVYPGHGPSTTINNELIKNPFF